jgi:hypothetical protein
MEGKKYFGVFGSCGKIIVDKFGPNIITISDLHYSYNNKKKLVEIQMNGDLLLNDRLYIIEYNKIMHWYEDNMDLLSANWKFIMDNNKYKYERSYSMLMSNNDRDQNKIYLQIRKLEDVNMKKTKKLLHEMNKEREEIDDLRLKKLSNAALHHFSMTSKINKKYKMIFGLLLKNYNEKLLLIS